MFHMFSVSEFVLVTFDFSNNGCDAATVSAVVGLYLHDNQGPYSVPPDAESFELEAGAGLWQTGSARIKPRF
jgi:hypothetical protein